jgi:hypothetical protein
MRFLRFGLAGLGWCVLFGYCQAEEIQVVIRSDYPGGNIQVVSNSGEEIQLAPDLRGGKPWFYWNFEAQASRPGRVRFTFGQAPRVGVCGPAISFDKGVSWRWLGHEHVTYDQPLAGDMKGPKVDSFHYDFTAEHLTVRFAVAIPYLHRDLEVFLKRHTDNPHLIQNVLTRTHRGTPIDLLTVGDAGADKATLLLTARHHACESMASYVLEGFVAEAISDTPWAIDFRRRFCLQVVPIVDIDGVEAGDQGKWRDPHDHNRDYGQTPLYPAVQAIQELAESQHVTYALDIHCPALRGDVHEAFYFDGLALPHLSDNVNEFIGWIKEERPPAAGVPLNFMKQPKGELLPNGLPFSHYFAHRPNMVFAATLEVPYTQRPCRLDAALARRYGAALLRAWTHTRFVPENEAGALRNKGSIAGLVEARTTFQRSYRGQSEKLHAEAEKIAADAGAPTPMQLESLLQLAVIELNQKQFAAAAEHCQSLLRDPVATTQQLAAANKVLVATICSDPDSQPGTVEAALEKSLNFPDAADEYLADVLEQACLYYERRADFARAVVYARRLQERVAAYKSGNVRLRVAAHLDQLKRPEEANAERLKAITSLRHALAPPPQSVFGALMVLDLFDGLVSLPTATLAEKQAAARLVLEHPVSSATTKTRVQKQLAELEAK